MTFLTPLILFALPLMALPIIIHLIHRHRHQTVEWGAMMFLVRAQRMNKGMARLRHILVLSMRVLAIAALIFAVSRPLASGWLSAGLGKPDATLILLDRSASMETQNLQTGRSKRSTALVKIAELLETRGFGDKIVLIDSASGEAQIVEEPGSLLDLPNAGPTATSADIPGMLESAAAWLDANESGRADVWICSDLRKNDWDTGSGRWNALREAFAPMKGVHHFLLSYADTAPAETPSSSNIAVRVSNVARRQKLEGQINAGGVDLVLDVELTRTGGESESRTLPVEFEVGGVRSVVDVELDSEGASILGHRISIDASLTSGWGSVSVPSDTNPLDDRFFFVFSEPAVRKAVVVSDDARTGEAFRRALAIPTDPSLVHEATVLTSSRTGEIDWENTGLLIWQAPLPTGLAREQIEGFVDSGRVALFFPPNAKNDSEIFSSRWGDWRKTADDEREVSWWRGDADLFAHSRSGDPLPLADLRTYQYCSFSSPGTPPTHLGTPLARLGNGTPLLSRVSTDRGGVYFSSTLPTAQFSSLARDGVVFYALLQRALAEGARSLDVASQRDAGSGALSDGEWETVTSSIDGSTVSERDLLAGVVRDGERWVALNRSVDEDMAIVVPTASVDALFDGLRYERIDDSVTSDAALVSEIWRTFLIAMALALVLEALFSLPIKRTSEERSSGGFEGFAPTSTSTDRRDRAEASV